VKVFDVVKSGWHELTHRPASQVPGLDALRAAAIFLVIGSHYAGSQWTHARGTPLAFAHNPIFNFGWTGVDLFFVLSGLLIGKQLWRELDKTGTVKVPRFLLRRGFRIWPLYFAIMGYLGVMHGLSFQWPDWVFLSNYVTTSYARSWSLSTEEQFYIVVPLLLLVTARFLPARARAWPIVALILAIPVVRVFEWRRLRALNLPAAELADRMHFPIHVHCEALFIGLLLALLSTSTPRLFAAKGRWGTSPLALGVLVLGIGAGLVLDKLDKDVFAFFSLALIFGSITFFVLADRSFLTRPLRSMVFYPFSRLAYGMYLNHFFFLHSSTAWTIAHFSSTLRSPLLVFLMGLVIGTAISAALAALTFVTIEHPFLLLREQLLGVPRETRATPSSADGSTLVGAS
jgi:peptidoglycan/LPS O-acetylase OafA/YrhL